LSDASANPSGSRRRTTPLSRKHRGVRFPAKEFLMFIAILDFATTAADRPRALAQLDAERAEIRAMPGNLAFRVYAARDTDTAVTVVHEWDDEVSFQRYTESASFSRSGEVLRPMMTGAPVSRRFRAELAETV
jgi:quinol monooxygenase YgiN